MFSAAANPAHERNHGAAPNTLVAPVDMGLPGSLPVVNEQAVRYSISLGLALGCSIAPSSRFARKNYFYPDLGKNYQISQYDEPIAFEGQVEVELADGTTFESRYSLIIPPLGGARAVADSPGLANPKGFIPVDRHYRHKDFPNIHAVGVAVALPPVEDTPVPVNFPKTGHMTEQMAKIAARDIAAEIRVARARHTS